MLFDNKKVKDFLPHRDPFLFVDTVESVEIENWKMGDDPIDPKSSVGGMVTAHFFVSPSMEILKGHFPGKPILPGVVQVEMMAQASSFVLQALVPKTFKQADLELALTGVTTAKFRRPILPGMKLVIRTRLTKFRAPMIVSDCQIFHDGQLMSEATVLASVRY
jgi:3-hydroxyacyl-[acyl-carrier-protein] dehydratase